MSRIDIYELLKKLIEQKYYEKKDDIVERIEVFYAHGRLTKEQYEELMKLADDMYY